MRRNSGLNDKGALAGGSCAGTGSAVATELAAKRAKVILAGRR
jgi:NADP-dependent 3-hydroxy acid dehydrogenase YdfG